MSTENLPQHESGGDSTGMSQTPSQQRNNPPRSPIERAFVWGLIGVLLVVAGIEARAYFAFQSGYRRILDELGKVEKQNDYRVTRAMVAQLLGGKEPASSETIRVAVGQERLDNYVWKGLLRNRTLYVHYGIQGTKEEPEVMEVSTD